MLFRSAVTNGLNPLSGIWARDALINPQVFPPGATHSTFSANPMGTAVALETLRMAAEGDYERTVAEKGAYFLEGLKELQTRWPQIGDVDGLGLALRCELCEADGFTPDRSLLDRMVAEGLKGDLEVGGQRMGLILNVGGYHKNVITLAPSLDITTQEIDLALVLMDQLLARCVRG